MRPLQLRAPEPPQVPTMSSHLVTSLVQPELWCPLACYVAFVL